MMDVLLPVFQLLYFVTHFLFSLAENVVTTWKLVFTFITSLTVFSSPSNPKPRELAKQPSHLGIILAVPSPSVATVGSLVVQAASYGVKFISIYDVFGDFTRRQSELVRQMTDLAGDKFTFVCVPLEREGQVSEREGQKIEKGDPTSEGEGQISGKEDRRGFANEGEIGVGVAGECENPGEVCESAEKKATVIVKFLGIQDGRQAIAAAAERLAGNVREESLSRGKLESSLGKFVSVPEKLENGPAKLETVPRELKNTGKLESLTGKLENVPGKLENSPTKLKNTEYNRNESQLSSESLPAGLRNRLKAEFPSRYQKLTPETDDRYLQLGTDNQTRYYSTDMRNRSTCPDYRDISAAVCLGLPDPELVVSLGVHSSLGYPPWKLRVSEIHFLDTGAGLGGVMAAYAGCEQRWGR